jgi:hypothetical protein
MQQLNKDFLLVVDLKDIADLEEKLSCNASHKNAWWALDNAWANFNKNAGRPNKNACQRLTWVNVTIIDIHANRNLVATNVIKKCKLVCKARILKHAMMDLQLVWPQLKIKVEKTVNQRWDTVSIRFLATRHAMEPWLNATIKLQNNKNQIGKNVATISNNVTHNLTKANWVIVNKIFKTVKDHHQ